MSKSKNLDDVVNDQIEKITGKKPLVFNPKKIKEDREARNASYKGKFRYTSFTDWKRAHVKKVEVIMPTGNSSGSWFHNLIGSATGVGAGVGAVCNLDEFATEVGVTTTNVQPGQWVKVDGDPSKTVMKQIDSRNITIRKGDTQVENAIDEQIKRLRDRGVV